MDVLRKNTDYAVRAMVYLARHADGTPASTRLIAESEDISYQLACKLMQKLTAAGLVQSEMGPKGGFTLALPADKISLGDVIKAIQDNIRINACLSSSYVCSRKGQCPVHGKLIDLQNQLDDYLKNITLAELAKNSPNKKGNKK
ncbi:MAG: Rrf2 family transcriptional regulator [Phycisphaerae bacterium]|nr:Rrf2 family transcriptional regulator [Phycisphaerae bacterium]